MKLSDWCKKEGINYKTGWNWFKANKLPVECYQTKTGTILVKENIIDSTNINKSNIKECIIYCRVSSHEKKNDLDRQTERCITFAVSNGFKINKVYKEIGSGMNDNRNQLIKLLNTNINYIIVENKDRLIRFGFNYIKILLERLNIEIIVINNSDTDKEDLMKDLISIITSFCGRIYGLRRSKKISNQIKNDLNCI